MLDGGLVSAGVTVSLINIPLSISLAVASQTTPIAGVITTLWAGIVVNYKFVVVFDWHF